MNKVWHELIKRFENVTISGRDVGVLFVRSLGIVGYTGWVGELLPTRGLSEEYHWWDTFILHGCLSSLMSCTDGSLLIGFWERHWRDLWENTAMCGE